MRAMRSVEEVLNAVCAAVELSATAMITGSVEVGLRDLNLCGARLDLPYLMWE